MKNKRMPIRMGLAALSTVLITSMSGCGTVKKQTNNDNGQREIILNTLLDSETKVSEIAKGLKFSKVVNDELEINNLMGEKSDKDGVEYYNYDVNIEDLNLANYTFDEMEQLVNGISNLRNEDKVYVREYLSNWLYYNNLFIDYENLYRIILASETNVEFVPLLDEDEFFLYMDEGEMLLNNSDRSISDDKVISNYYGISIDAARDLVSLINSKPDPRFMVKEMNDTENEKFGSEDYIPELENQLSVSAKMLNIIGWKYYDKVNDVMNDTKSKTKSYKFL